VSCWWRTWHGHPLRALRASVKLRSKAQLVLPRISFEKWLLWTVRDAIWRVDADTKGTAM